MDRISLIMRAADRLPRSLDPEKGLTVPRIRDEGPIRLACVVGRTSEAGCVGTLVGVCPSAWTGVGGWSIGECDGPTEPAARDGSGSMAPLFVRLSVVRVRVRCKRE